MTNDPKIKMMMDKLTILSSEGDIEDAWTENFIWDIKKKLDAGQSLTEKQLKKLEEVFEKN